MDFLTQPPRSVAVSSRVASTSRPSRRKAVATRSSVLDLPEPSMPSKAMKRPRPSAPKLRPLAVQIGVDDAVLGGAARHVLARAAEGVGRGAGGVAAGRLGR